MQNESMKSEGDSPFKPVTGVRIPLGSLQFPSETRVLNESQPSTADHRQPTTSPPRAELNGRHPVTLNAIKPSLLALASGDIAERFASKFTPEPNTGCWLWTAALNNCGYAVLSLGSRKGRTSLIGYAHRIAWELEHGPVPEGLTLDHRCRVRHCVNPAHLEPVSHQVNCQRRSPARVEQFLLPDGTIGDGHGQGLEHEGRRNRSKSGRSVGLSHGATGAPAVAEHGAGARLKAPVVLLPADLRVAAAPALARVEDAEALALACEAFGRVRHDDADGVPSAPHGNHSQHQHERSHGRENSSHAEVRQ
jgi:hypothetical protein